jgi:hypothetical protein
VSDVLLCACPHACRKFNSYLRTMPHADYPSGTSCVCIAWAKFTERYLNRIDTMPYQAKFIKVGRIGMSRCSTVVSPLYAV